MTKNFFEHISVLNHRNDVTSYALARSDWDLFGVEFVFFFIVLAPRASGKYTARKTNNVGGAIKFCRRRLRKSSTEKGEWRKRPEEHVQWGKQTRVAIL